MQALRTPTPVRPAANEAVFYRPPARLWNVTYHLRTGDTGCVHMISRTMAGAVRKVIETKTPAALRAVHATAAQVHAC